MTTDTDLLVTPDAPRSASPLKSCLLALLEAVILLAILAAGFYFRFVGIDWGEYQYLHPDERFLVWVGADITPVKTLLDANGAVQLDANGEPQKVWMSLGEYFDTANSTMNPHNRGHPLYVYGTLPMFLTRVAVELIYGHGGWNEMTDVGRPMSAFADWLTILVLYALARRLFGGRVGLLAAAFYAAAALPIQQSHFFTMDTYAVLFTLLAVYVAVEIAVSGQQSAVSGQPFPVSRSAWLSLLFGLVLGCAAASKINVVPVAVALPLAWVMRLVSVKRLTLNVDERSRGKEIVVALLSVAAAAFLSLLVFRVAQPYAFSGPGFFNVTPNEAWVKNIADQQSLARGDWPPSMQWARRNFTFSGVNLTMWGLGLPLGLLAWTGFLAAGWRLLKGDWQKHLLIWGWTGAYFLWQSFQPNPTMRYQLPIYPLLALYAGWIVITASRARLSTLNVQRLTLTKITRLAALLAGSVVFVATFAYAFGFTRIYVTPITRIEASRWIFQNIPGPITLHITGEDGAYSQPIAFPYTQQLLPEQPYNLSFTALSSGQLGEVFLPHVSEVQTGLVGAQVTVILSALPNGEQPLAMGGLSLETLLSESGDFSMILDQPVALSLGQIYYLTIQLSPQAGEIRLCNPLTLRLSTPNGMLDQALAPAEPCAFSPEHPYMQSFVAPADGVVGEIYLPPGEAPKISPSAKTLTLTLKPAGQPEAQPITAQAEIPAGAEEARFALDAFSVEKGKPYELSLTLGAGGSPVTLLGSAVANEGDWDDGLPVRTDGLDGFGGVYQPGLNFNMYTDDNADKLARFIDILDQAEYIFISSNRQWGSLPRIPERFPMSTAYYRALLGCPAEKEIYWCYAVAQPGMFNGELGFELAQVFQSDPRIGSIRINDQFAEEAFTVYDHPKVLIFKKTAAYDPQRPRDILGAVDLSKVVRISPFDASSYPADLSLPAERLAEQQAGGTWSDLFNSEALYNRYPFLSVVIWYLLIAVVGWLAYPLIRLALPGLADRGYPLARIGGLIFWAWLVWMAGSQRIPFSPWTIFAGLLILASVGFLAVYHQRAELRQELKDHLRYFLLVEVAALGFFAIELLIRLGNPDLWHPFLGGEKPMDFAYFNAVLKSTSFPPYDPWYAGGYLNYYYYGYVLVAVPVKLLGITPSIAYNLILPTLFSLTGLGAFSIGWNVWAAVTGDRRRTTDDGETTDDDEMTADGRPPTDDGETTADEQPPRADEGFLNEDNSQEDASVGGRRSAVISQRSPVGGRRSAVFAGLLAALFVLLLGNLGTLKLIVQAWQRLAAPGGDITTGGFLLHLQWTFDGLAKALSGAALPLRLSDWYWLPSRAIAAPGDVEPITEFPFFTFLYADLHAHMIALPITLLAIAWALSAVLGRARWRGVFGVAASFSLGGLAIGALRPTNTWDFYPYLLLGVIAFGYAVWRYLPTGRFPSLPGWSQKLIASVGGVLLLVVLSFLLYQPFTQWFALGYSKIDPWRGTHTQITDYLIHWGLFLFLIVSWMVWETRDWMAATPLSSLRKLEPYSGLLITPLVIILFWVLGLIALKLLGAESDEALANSSLAWYAALMWLKAPIAWLALPLMGWAGILLLRPGLPDAKRFMLFLFGTGLALSVMVEGIVLQGDIGRMNTVFKFYIQAWVLFALCAAAALVWLWPALKGWLIGWRVPWTVLLGLLLFATALYPLYATMGKVKDRFAAGLPHTLDGMTYMQYVTYNNLGNELTLAEDYRAIRWVQENIEGSPVIVEAAPAGVQYYWFSRLSIYTGLPTVVGWQWHQEQQRVKVPGGPVAARGLEVGEFYRTTSREMVETFIRKYNAQYIVVGQLELGTYKDNPEGLAKFEQWEGELWTAVYRDGQTVIYQVNGE